MNNASSNIEDDEDVREYRAALVQSSELVRKQLRVAGIATGALLTCMFLTFLFLDVGPFHSHWNPYGEIVLTLTLAALIAALYYDLLAWGAWNISRTIRKELKEFLEDRFGVTSQ